MMGVFVVLLRAIGPVTHKIMSMADWRQGVEDEGFTRAETFLATGNMVVEGDGSAAAVTRRMNAVVERLGLSRSNVAVVRSPRQLATLVKANPFPDAAEQRPSQMGVYFFAGARPDFSWIADYQGHERLSVVNAHLVVDYQGGVSQSLRLPGIIEKQAGVATARNWNTLRGLAERSAARLKSS
jgi:uncharacterized protein (DUF1697 family)